MLWLDKYKPTNLNDFSITNESIQRIDNWFNDFKQKIVKTPPALLITGMIGSGKTTLALYLLEKYNYEVKEFNVSDKRTDKNIQYNFGKLLNNNSILAMLGGKKNGILMDDIDLLISSADDRGGIKAFTDILVKLYKKNQPIKKKKKGQPIKESILPDVPIICTTTKINDKKIREIEKYCLRIDLKPIDNKLLEKTIKNILDCEDLIVKEKLLKKIISEIPRPINIRNVIIDLYNLYLNLKIQKKKKLTSKNISILTTEHRTIDIKLYESINAILNDELEFDTGLKYYEMDSMTVPIMIHENYLTKIYSRTWAKPSHQLKAIKKISDSLAHFDYYQNAIFRWQSRQMNKYVGVYSVSIPNFWTNALGPLKGHNTLRYTSLLNKMSLYYNNRKLINRLKINNLTTTNEIVYLSELITREFFEENGNFKQGIKYLKAYNLRPDDLDILVRINKLGTSLYRKKLTDKFKNELQLAYLNA